MLGINRVRLARVLARALAGGIGPTAESTLDLRVGLADLDLNLHMNNARYLSAMDVGRWDLTVRSGLLVAALRRRMQPVIVDLDIRFRRELRPGARFTLVTRYDGIEGRKLWFSQVFRRGDAIHAEARVGSLILHKGKVVGRDRVEALLGAIGLELDARPGADVIPLRPTVRTA